MSLVLEEVGVWLGARQVLSHVSLAVRPGELVVLFGPSGAGKTTLIRAAAGLVRATGRITAAAPRPAVIFQHHALARRLTALDNVLVGALGRIGFARAALRIIPRPERELAERCLERVGMPGFAARRADTLSGGQRQRVAIARALMQRCPVMLADEPVASLDPENAERIMELLRDLAHGDNLTVLVALHQPELAKRYATRRLELRDGRITASSVD